MLACRKLKNVKLIFTEHGRHQPDKIRWKRFLFNKFFSRKLSCRCPARIFSVKVRDLLTVFLYAEIFFSNFEYTFSTISDVVLISIFSNNFQWNFLFINRINTFLMLSYTIIREKHYFE